MKNKESNKRLQVLVATTEQIDYSLLTKMNIQSDVIVGNQTNENKIEELTWNGYRARFLNFQERGVGLNRNNCLMRATAEFCLFADDDMVYVDNYPELVIKAFTDHPDADVILFNIDDPSKSRFVVEKTHRVRFWNYMRYGTVRIAVRREPIQRLGISFNLYFGGGAKYSHGEDTLFLASCLKEGLKIIAVPVLIARLTNCRKSTWANGFGKQYLFDQGALYRTISRRYYPLLCLQDALRHSNRYRVPALNAFRLMLSGAREK